MPTMQCLHTAVLVSDLSRAENFYGQVLGLVKVDRPLGFPGTWYQIGAYQLHLIAEPQMKIELSNSLKWGRNPHIAFGVSDLKPYQEHLQAQGYPIQMSNSGRCALFTQDPDGNIIEISQV